MNTQPPELIDEEMASQDSAPISTPADNAPLSSAVLHAKESIATPVDIEMKDAHNNIHAPPSPAPSGDSQQATTVHRRSPSPAAVNSTYSAADHPETSIPSPASPSAAAPLPVEPVPSAPVATKHEYEEDPDAMTEEDQRPAKRARTAEVASVSVSFHFYPASIAGQRFCACDRRRFVHPICIIHRFLTALHSHAHSMLRWAPFCQILCNVIRLLLPLPLHQPRPRSPYLSRLLLFLRRLIQRFPLLNLNLRKVLSALSASKKTPIPSTKPLIPSPLTSPTTLILYPNRWTSARLIRSSTRQIRPRS